MKVILFVSFTLLIFAKVTCQSGAPTATSMTSLFSNGQCSNCCSYNQADQLANIKQNIDFIFGLQQKMDIVFVVKNSQGFEQTRLQQVKDFLNNLTDYLVLSGRLIVHPDYARIALFTFADTVVTIMNGVVDLTGYYDACRFSDYIRRMQLSTFTLSSDPYNVLKETADTFARSGRNVTRILFYFDNGSNWLPSTSTANKAASVVSLLQNMQVHRFAAAVGLPPVGWMDSLQKEMNVQSVASDTSNYYACMDEWTEAINDAITTVLNSDNQGYSNTYFMWVIMYCIIFDCILLFHSFLNEFNNFYILYFALKSPLIQKSPLKI